MKKPEKFHFPWDVRWTVLDCLIRDARKTRPVTQLIFHQVNKFPKRNSFWLEITNLSTMIILNGLLICEIVDRALVDRVNFNLIGWVVVIAVSWIRWESSRNMRSCPNKIYIRGIWAWMFKLWSLLVEGDFLVVEIFDFSRFSCILKLQRFFVFKNWW